MKGKHMVDLELVAHLLSRRCFAEAAYFGALSALKSPRAEAHMLAGVGCCGCAEPLAMAQRLLEDVPVHNEEVGAGVLRISPATELPYEGFFHLIEAVRLDPAIKAPRSLREVFDAVADDLAYVSRREIHRPPGKRRRYSHGIACVSAAVLLRRLTSNDRELPGVASPSLEGAMEIIDAELGRSGGDATFF
jgi:hypothetical protein